jgi:protein TonB
MPIAPPGRPAPPPPNTPETRPRMQRVIPSQIRLTGLIAPVSIPPKAAAIVDVEMPAVAGGPYVPGGIPGSGGGPGGIAYGISDLVDKMIPIVKPPEPVKHDPSPAPETRVAPPRITSVRMATPIHRVDPVYPPLARQARVSGTVELLGVLGTDGRIHELKVLRGHPLLVNAAIAAVRQWIYEPTLLNGQAVEVSAPITVNFILN